MRWISSNSAAASDERIPLAAIVFCKSKIKRSTGSVIIFCRSLAAVVIDSGNTLAAFMLTSLPRSIAVPIPVSSPATTPTACRRCLLAISDASLAASADTRAPLPPAAATDRSMLFRALALLSSLVDLTTAPAPDSAAPTTPIRSSQSSQPPHVCSALVATSCTTKAACQSVISQLPFKSLYKPSSHSPFLSSAMVLNTACKLVFVSLRPVVRLMASAGTPYLIATRSIAAPCSAANGVNS